ncbi:sensor domain-containing diguanylate cyclase [Musicola keenii]|uniref:sensor domain-containing diguanylate cyclase n=1 Tax=Musicola keenii TaxID=2884250 RepID=UPI0017865210|nr:sensor domain-containing diguanylate cyclase [Musicola keenii]
MLDLTQNDIKQIYMSLPVASCLIDREQRYIAANKKYAELLGKDLSEIVGKKMLDVIKREYADNVTMDFMLLDNGLKPNDHEITFGDKILFVAISPIRTDDQVIAISVSLTDITRQKEIEKQLELKNRELDRINRKIMIDSETDPLTLLKNRRGLDNYLARLVSAPPQTSFPLSIAIIDIDYFKQYNDMYGHILGDACIEAVAGKIGEAIDHHGAFAARFGGDEFILVFPHFQSEQAETICHRLRCKVQGLGMEHRGSPYGFVTLSIGIFGTDALPDGTSADMVKLRLLQQADNALYEAKRRGRNQIYIMH